METNHWSQQQTALVKPMTDMVSSSYPKPLLDRKARPQKEQALNCPRCHSTNTKFCYYNNYSLTQPRYFCKTCRRYWTEGGSLRNVPVGGGSRKNKRSSSSSTSTSKKIHEDTLSGSSQIPSQNTRILGGQDLNLTIQSTPDFHHTMNEFGVLANNGSANNNNNPSALELLNGISSRGLNHFNPILPLQPPEPNVLYSNGFGVPYLRPTLTFPLDDNNLQEIPDSNGRLMYQSENLKPNFHQNRNQGETTGYWNGMLGNGSW